ncbi:MAG: glycosyltransferase [Planctomycetaceae bacterium]|nr:glycosyltransferase [Planctomycetaceae bacterium]
MNTILHCIPSMGGGGAERQLAYLAAALKDLGWQVHVALRQDGGVNLQRLEASGATVHALGTWHNYDLRNASRIAAIVKRTGAQLVQSWLTAMDICGSAAARRAGVPWILCERGDGRTYPEGFWTLKNALRRRAAPRAAAIVCNSAAADIYWRVQIASCGHCVIPNIVPLEEIQAAPAFSREQLGATAQDKLLVYAGRLERGKNLPVLLQALAVLRQRVPARLLLCGTGSQAAALADAARRLGLGQAVLFAGYVDNLWSCLKAADAMVSLSKIEGRPNAVLEAMACGCPLILSDIDAHREIVDGTQAAFVQPDNAAHVAAVLGEVLGDASAARAKAQRAAQACGAWSASAVAAQYDRLYRQVLAGEGGR